MPLPPALRPIGSVLVLALLAGVVGACTRGGPPAAETPAASVAGGRQASPAPTSTPLPPPSEDEALRLRRNGQFDEAIAAFRAIAERGREDQRLRARLGLARTLLEAGEPDAAEAEAQALIRALPPPGATPAAPLPVVEREATLLLATAQSAAGAPEAALQTYAAYLAAGGDAAPYALLDQALLLAKSGRVAEAETVAEAALARDLPDGTRAAATAEMARTLENAGASDEALAWWQRYVDASDDAFGLLRVSEIKRQRGDASWEDDARRIVSDYPRSPAAAAAMEALDRAGRPVDEYERGVVAYRQGQDSVAREAFAAYLLRADAPRAAQAAFYLAALDERAGDDAAAIDGYARSLTLDPRNPQADDAHWWRGRLLEQAGRLDEAYRDYEALAIGYPDSPFAADAVFRRGLVRYLQGRTQEAIDIWQGAAKAASTPAESRRNAFWAAKATFARERGAGRPLLEAIVARDGSDWYGLRAQAILYPPKGGEDRVRLETAIDWAALDEWAAATLGSDPNLGLEPLLLDQHWATGQTLVAVGRVAEGRRELRLLLDRYGGQPVVLYQLARSFARMQETELAARAATRVLALLPDPQRLAAPADLYRLAYPADYADLLANAQQERKTPPLLMLALIRQESYFDPLAGSGAGALGLTQVVPATARSIAEALHEDRFRDNDLYRPVVSLRFGASYLAEQLKAFGGNFYYALAAYNGGPSTASRAKERADGDPDLFVEQLEFDETRTYVKLVSENYGRYRQLYAGLPQPELPAP